MGKKTNRKLIILILSFVLITSAASLVVSGLTFNNNAVIDKAPLVLAINITNIATDGKIVFGMPIISVNPTDDKGISKVEFYTKAVSAPDSSYYKVNTVTTSPYSAKWATSPWIVDGEYTIKVVVYDTTNQTAKLTRNVLVRNTTVAPTNLLSAAKIYTNVLLSWTAASGAAGYEVYEGINKVGATTIATDFMVTGLKAETNYTFTVKAKDTLGNISSANNSVAVKTEAQAAVNQISLNSYVAKVISEYEIGKYSYLLNNDY
ncbi:MAG: chitodextrinase [Clostridium sp.]|jgi:chitodextrinase